jgi:hypothetical protein
METGQKARESATCGTVADEKPPPSGEWLDDPAERHNWADDDV